MNENGLKPRDYEQKRYVIAKDVFAGFAAYLDADHFSNYVSEYADKAVKAADALLDKLNKE